MGVSLGGIYTPGGYNRQFYIRDAQGNVMAVYKDQTSYVNWMEQHLYGSNRLGIWNFGKAVPGVPGTTYQDTTQIGVINYELSNHLGNVLTTISDKKIGVSTNNSTVDYYRAVVLSQNDFYPGGMLQPGRKFTAGTGYRYGFNGKENDNEVKGDGNQYDYGFRIYDPRTVRFLSVDPLVQEYPWYTPFQYASNSPIANVDVDGLEAAGVGCGCPMTQLESPKAAENTGKAIIAMGRGIGTRVFNILDYISTHTPWNIDDRAQNDRTENFTNFINTIRDPKQAINNVRQELKETGRKLMSSDPNEVGDAMAGVTVTGAVTAISIYSVYRSVTVTIRTVASTGRAVYKAIESSSIRVSQESISGRKFEAVFKDMKANGWKNQDPIDIVKMDDGMYTTFDHNRLVSAEKLGLKIEATVHNFNDPFPLDRAQAAFQNLVDNGTLDKLPTTWGEAVQARVLNQSSKFAKQNPNGTFVRPRVTGTGNNQTP